MRMQALVMQAQEEERRRPARAVNAETEGPARPTPRELHIARLKERAEQRRLARLNREQ